MPPRRKPVKPGNAEQLIADARRGQADREKTYREKALNLFDHVCGRCAREFAGKNLRELTVHHKDGNHDNNPPDGSNWELLCLYCHDDEHQTHRKGNFYDDDDYGDEGEAAESARPSLGFSAFEGLKNLLPQEDGEEKSE